MTSGYSPRGALNTSSPRRVQTVVLETLLGYCHVFAGVEGGERVGGAMINFPLSRCQQRGPGRRTTVHTVSFHSS